MAENNMLKKLLVASALSSSLIMFGCSSMPSAAQQQANLTQLQNKTWILTHIGAVEYKTDPTAHNVPSLQFDAATQRVSGADGCNRLMGGYSIKGEQLSLNQLASTQMLCNNTAELASKYNQALAKVSGYQVYAKTLRLLDSHGNPVLQFESAVQPR